MIPRALIFLSMLLTTHISQTMEVTKKNKNKKHRSTKNYWGNPIITQFILTQRICDKYKLIKEITENIKHYNIALKKNTFEKNPGSFRAEWGNFYIPEIYHYHLTSQQMNLLQELLTSTRNRNWNPEQGIYYTLESHTYYPLFKTIPMAIRIQLSLLPHTERTVQEHLQYPGTITNLKINNNQTILVKKNLAEKLEGAISHDPTVGGIHWTHYREKPILPENKK